MSMAVDQSLNLKPGSVIQGKYEIVRCLGAGSMGMVYAVKHIELQGRVLAMKVLFSDVAKDEVQSARFRNEIVASYEINHPHVVRAYDFFREGDLVAYTMEYISGGDLADRLNEEELIPIPQAIDMLEQMASGVEAIHKAGIIHRDLKPENILMTEDGSVKITDFGIAKNLKGPRLTDHGGIVGTFAYVSPEYLESGNVDVRSDIYSLGVLAYEMIAGQAPYNGKNVIEEMHLRLTTDPLPLNSIRPECPEELSRIVLKALNRNPFDRYQTARELRIEISKISNSTRGFTRTDFSRKPEVVKPMVLDNDMARMISGLKNSLEERAIISGHISEVEVNNQIQNQSSLVSTFFEEEQALSNYARPISISKAKLSAEKIKELKDDLSDRDYRYTIDDSTTPSFEFTGYFLTSIAGILFGLVVVNWLSPSSIPETIDRLTGIFK
jgi:serine/threonine protein kinase